MSKEVDHYLTGDGLDSDREKMIGQTIGYRYDVNLVPDMDRCTPYLKEYMTKMNWDDLNWLEDVHMGYEEDRAAVFDRNINGWVTIPDSIDLPNNQQDRDMIRKILIAIPWGTSPKNSALKSPAIAGLFCGCHLMSLATE